MEKICILCGNKYIYKPENVSHDKLKKDVRDKQKAIVQQIDYGFIHQL